MYFYKQKGKQILDFRGDLIVTHNDSVVKARIKSAAPASVRNIKYIANIPSMGIYRKIKATFAVLGFIWGKNTALTPETIKEDGL